MINIVKTVVCDRCKKVIEDGEPIWFISQQGEYGSMYDNEFVSVEICDDCLDDFMGMVRLDRLEVNG